jgi:hypothetical protein
VLRAQGAGGVAAFYHDTERVLISLRRMECRRALVLVACSLAVGPNLHAQVDQESWLIREAKADRLNPDVDLRQEFTPTLPALDSLQLSIGQNGMPIFSLESSVAGISLRDGGANGPINCHESPPRRVSAAYRGGEGGAGSDSPSKYAHARWPLRFPARQSPD